MPIYDDFASPQCANQPYQSQGRDAGWILCNFFIPPLCRDGEKTYLHEYELGRARDAPEESAEYGPYLVSDFDGRNHYERQLSQKWRWLRKIQKVDVREREQRWYRFRACGRSGQ